MSIKGNDEQGKIDLLVFGYACKLFRDDEKALMIDSGSHLIPWMGDETLKIDRYDGRGALYDLSAHEPKADSKYELTEEEKTVEQICDQERYRSLYINEEEEIFYRSEIAKRSQKKEQEYSEVAYNYDVPNYPGDEPSVEDAPSKPFVPPPDLKIPHDMKVPETVKHNAILERTALFLAQQGPQMEILMKVKQQGNKNFDFLSHTDELHRYYLHLKALIKAGSYVPKEQYMDDDIGANQKGDYLHPTHATNAPTPMSEDQKVKPPPPNSISPPDYMQKIIAIMVRYVLKNGNRFESTVMKRGDLRFSFLNPKNPYHSFYQEELRKKQAKTEVLKTATGDACKPKKEEKETGKSLKRKPIPVCFSIKKPKESEGLEVSSALLMEESSDEDETGSVSSPKQQKTEPDVDVVNSLEKRLKKSSEVTKKHKEKKDLHLQNERKMKVAQFLKDLKKKGT
ncbi:splicing factor, suppressor of white-apricot homolog isoform X2 [Cimex lectularius]|nr:splicing factor, suppressor of white-apricot homolog isoform X2 [Cimex lectularius]